MTAVVADASPLIAFHQIDQLSLLRALFTTVFVPPAVAHEIARSVPSQPWIIERRLTQPVAPPVLEARLGAGESEAISLALDLHIDRLLVDERAARKVATSLGLNLIGTLGVLLAAKRESLIPAVRPQVEALLEKNFWISPRLVARTLASAGEDVKS